jgi:monoamine oxidase
MISRRAFLLDGAAAMAAVSVAPAALRPLPRPTRAKRVLIAGAGAAGLCAAWELVRAGHEVLVFEAKMIPGGRIHTIRAPFADGLYAEAGAMYLGSNSLAAQYAREFGLELTPLPFRADVGSLAHVAGERIALRAGQPPRWPITLSGEDSGQGIRALQGRYFRSRLAQVEGGLEGLNAADWPLPAHLPYDDMSLAELWRRNGASDAAIRIMRLTYFDALGEGIESVSALQFMREFGTFVGATGFFEIRGGNDLLPRAFAERLGPAMRYGTPVVAIQHDAASVEITIEGAGGREQVRGDYLIVTLPFPLLRRVAVTPSFDATRVRAIKEIQPTSVTRVYVQCRQRFWDAEGLDGAAATDLPIQQIFHATVAQTGTRGILESYTTGPRARRLAAMGADDRLHSAMREMARVHPELPRYAEGGASYVWDNDPWARGDFSYFKPGQIRRFFPHIQRPEGRIYFAGDTIGGIPGYIEGAMRSARTAAESIARTA